MARRSFPALAQCTIHCGDMVEAVLGGRLAAYDALYSKAALSCVHPSVDEAFWAALAGLARKYVICIDHAADSNGVTFGRDYAEVFRPYGLACVFSEDLRGRNLGSGLNGYRAVVLARNVRRG